MENELLQKKISTHQSNGAALEDPLSEGQAFGPPVFQLQAGGSLPPPAEKAEKEEGDSASVESALSFDAPPGENNKQGFEHKGSGQNGLPFQLKKGVEQLSGVSMDDVKVHYNSSRPAQLKALAYAQGSDIHVASGQERHIPHEAWHVVQQKQGRVQPTMQMKGNISINDSDSLESEADTMGAKALSIAKYPGPDVYKPVQMKTAAAGVAQLMSDAEELELKGKIGAYKFGKAKEAGYLDHFAKLKDSELEEIKNQPRVDFDKSLRYLFLKSDDDFQEPEPEGWMGWIMSGLGFGKEKEGEKDLISHDLSEGYGANNNTTDQSLTPEGAQSLVEDKDEEEEGGSTKETLIKMVEINLGELKIPEGAEKEFGNWGKAEASGGISGKASSEGLSSEAKIEIKLGKGRKEEIGFGSVGSDGTNLTAGGTIEGHLGAKGKAEVSASFDPSKYEGKVKGKFGATLGASSEGTVQVMVKGGGMQIAKFMASLGIVAGLAGEYTYILKWADGELVIGSGGKAAIGIGMSWNYKMKLNTPGLMAKFGDSISSWASWGKQKLGY